MAKKSKIARNQQRAEIVAKYRERRVELLQTILECQRVRGRESCGPQEAASSPARRLAHPPTQPRIL